MNPPRYAPASSPTPTRGRRRPPCAPPFLLDPPAARVVRQEGVLELEHERAVAAVGLSGERGADVDETDPEPVADAQLHPARVAELVHERVVDRKQVRLQRRLPVHVEEHAPELACRDRPVGERLDHVDARPRRRSNFVWMR